MESLDNCVKGHTTGILLPNEILLRIMCFRFEIIFRELANKPEYFWKKLRTEKFRRMLPTNWLHEFQCLGNPVLHEYNHRLSNDLYVHMKNIWYRGRPETSIGREVQTNYRFAKQMTTYWDSPRHIVVSIRTENKFICPSDIDIEKHTESILELRISHDWYGTKYAWKFDRLGCRAI